MRTNQGEELLSFCTFFWMEEEPHGNQNVSEDFVEEKPVWGTPDSIEAYDGIYAKEVRGKELERWHLERLQSNVN